MRTARRSLPYHYLN